MKIESRQRVSFSRLNLAKEVGQKKKRQGGHGNSKLVISSELIKEGKEYVHIAEGG